MAKPKGGLTKWFKKEKAKGSKRGYPKCVPTAKANRMTKSQIKSAVTRKRANPKGKVKTILKKGKK